MRFEPRWPGGRDRSAERRLWKCRIAPRGWPSSSPLSFRSCLAVGFRLRRHDTSRFNQAVEVSVMPLPFCDRFGTRRRSNVTTFDFAPVFSCLIDCAPPGLGIAQRAFDCELSPIFIDEDQKPVDLLTAPNPPRPLASQQVPPGLELSQSMSLSSRYLRGDGALSTTIAQGSALQASVAERPLVLPLR